MKNILIISLALLLGACSAVDKTVVEINPRPTLTLGYRYINGQGQNTTAKEVA